MEESREVPAPRVVGSLDDVAAVLLAAARPVLLCHRSPDGDTVGAAVALAMALRVRGSAPTIVCADPLPPSLDFIPDGHTIGTVLPSNPDLLVNVDISDPHMLGDLYESWHALRERLRCVNIDHHASDTAYGDVNLIDTNAASTAEIVYDFVVRIGVAIDTSMATALLTGIINDTHSFQNSNTTTRALATSAALVSAGADASTISHNLLLRRRPQSARLWGQALSTLRLEEDGTVSSAVATEHMMQATGADLSDLDGIVEFLRNIDGVDLAFLMKETAPDQFKLSIRTTARVDAVELTAPFGGGGHRRAAGCDLSGSPDDVRAAIVARYRELVGRP